eukprot:2508968-Amphidinium_carterae.2
MMITLSCACATARPALIDMDTPRCKLQVLYSLCTQVCHIKGVRTYKGQEHPQSCYAWAGRLQQPVSLALRSKLRRDGPSVSDQMP